MKRKPRLALFLLGASLLLSLLAACGEDGEGPRDILPGSGGPPEAADPAFERTPPPLVLAEFGNENIRTAEQYGVSVLMDMTHVNRGYVAARATASVKCLFEVLHTGTGEKYYYPLDGSGKDQFYPLAMGNGTYQFTVHANAPDAEGNPTTSYYPALQDAIEVALENDKAPFLVNSAVVDYGADSSAVTLSYQLAQHSATNLEVIQQVYYWIENNIKYDVEKAEYVQTSSSYVPNLDQVLTDKQGICYDYASLAAAMLRANGIPCQMIFGDVNTGDDGGVVYHAWNLVWTEEDGWIAAKIAAHPNGWVQIDLTFASSLGSDISGFVGSGENYDGTSVH